MSLPGAKKQHKIEHLCCQKDSKFKAINGQHVYQCSACGETDRAREKSLLHSAWRDKHIKGCFYNSRRPGGKLAKSVSGTERELIVAIKQGKVLGVKHDRFNPRNARFTWKEA